MRIVAALTLLACVACGAGQPTTPGPADAQAAADSAFVTTLRAKLTADSAVGPIAVQGTILERNSILSLSINPDTVAGGIECTGQALGVVRTGMSRVADEEGRRRSHLCFDRSLIVGLDELGLRNAVARDVDRREVPRDGGPRAREQPDEGLLRQDGPAGGSLDRRRARGAGAAYHEQDCLAARQERLACLRHQAACEGLDNLQICERAP